MNKIEIVTFAIAAVIYISFVCNLKGVLSKVLIGLISGR